MAARKQLPPDDEIVPPPAVHIGYPTGRGYYMSGPDYRRFTCQCGTEVSRCGDCDLDGPLNCSKCERVGA